MARGRLKHWFLSRFVLIAEVLGYVLALAVIGGAVATAFFRVEVLLNVNGTLAPASSKIVLEEDCTVARLHADTGDAVIEGQRVAEAVFGERDMRRASGVRKIIDGLALLGDEEDAQLGAVLRMLARVSEQGDGETRALVAPMAGFLTLSRAAQTAEPIPAGDAVATVHDLGALVLRAPVPANRVDRVREGQPARVNWPDPEAPLEGQVARLVEAEDGAVEAVLRFEPLPGPVREACRARLLEGDAAFPEVAAAVVLGDQSLFTRLFGKRQ